MPTQKKFLDEAGLIQLLQEIESLDETNLKDVYWSTDNADVSPTIVFKQGDDNGSAHSIHKVTFAGDTSSNIETALTGTKYEVRSITITIGGVSKTISYLVTTRLPSTAVNHSHSNDTGDPTAATTVKAALDRVINKLNSMVGTDEKVKQTAQTGSTALPILTAVSGTPTSGANAEAGYDTDFKFTPSSNTLTVKAATSSASGVTITPSSIKVGTTATNGAAELTPSQLKVGSGTLTSTAYSGKATQTETDLNTVATDKGADMVAYSSSDSVKDALDDIYSQIGGSGGGGDSLTSRVTALEGAVDDLEDNKADITAAVGSITGASDGNESGSYTMVDGTTETFSYKNDKVAQGSTTAAGTLPLLLAGSATPTGAADVAKFNANIYAAPSTGELMLRNPNTPSTYVTFASDGIQWRKQSGTGQMSLTFDGGFSGNSATATLATNATNDGSGNNIVNTYATKAALEALTNQLTGSFQIVSALPTADGTHGGIIYLIKDQEYGDTNSNIFKEYIEVNDGTTASPSWKFELLGTTDAGVDVVSIPATGTNSVASMFVQYVTNA